MSEETEKYKKALEKFHNKMASLRKRKSELLTNISKKFDQQQIESLRKKLKGHV